jgi:integrase
VLLDALEALDELRNAVVLVGAQAIYLHTGDAKFAIAPYTTDGDVAIDPSRLADLPPVRFHDLRHTCATILLVAGKHPKYVQELLGHASISITLDTYSHVIEGMDDGLADAMDERL